MTDQVFISYSHKDYQTLKDLQRFLKPLHREGSVIAWDDRQIKPSEKWLQVIEQALEKTSIAILFISQHFLASDFIAEKELPYLLKKAQQGQITLLPVFLSPSTVDKTLTQWQGFGTPDQPLSDLSWSDRERVYVQINQRISELTSSHTSTLATKQPIDRPRQDPTPKNYELCVHLHRQGQKLELAYQLPGYDPFLAISQPWSDYADKLKTIFSILDQGDAGQLQSLINLAANDYGQILYKLLFGSDNAHHETIFRTAFHQHPPEAQPTALRAPLRLRIISNEPSLLSLPWRLTAWNNRLLMDNGWVFLPSTLSDPQHDYTTTAPCYILVITAENTRENPQTDSNHIAAIEEAVQSVWSGTDPQPYLRTVRTLKALKNALRGQPPHLIYVHCHTAMDRGRPCLLLDGETNPSPLPLSDLTQQFQHHAPAVLYFNTTGPVAIEADAVYLFEHQVPLILWRRTPHRHVDADSLAIAWLRAWLQQGQDPLTALHQAQQQHFSASPEAAALAVLAHYRHWRTDVKTTSHADQYAHLRLNRDKQKGLVAKWLGEMLGSDNLRVMSLIPYGEANNALDKIHQQLQHYLEFSLPERIAIKQYTLPFPEHRAQLRQYLEQDLVIQLNIDDGESLTALLRRCVPRYSGRQRPVLWLHWGVFGNGKTQQTALRPSELQSWLSFCCHYLSQHCPTDIRIICTLAIELDKQKHQKLEDNLIRYHDELEHSAFWPRILEPVGSVAKHELRDYLNNSQNGCPAPIRSEMANRLMQASDGIYDELVKLIEEAGTTSWNDLLNRLRYEQGAAQADDDEPL